MNIRDQVRQARGEKQKLLDAIGALLSDFTRDTDLVIERINIQHITEVGCKHITYLLDVDINL